MTTINTVRLIYRGLWHYRRTNFAILLGVVVGTAVIGGALIVGDSVRASLRKMTLDRLGKIDFAMVGARFVREDLADRLVSAHNRDSGSANKTVGPVAPAIVMQAGLQAKSGGAVRRAGQVNVYGFDSRAWNLMDTGGLDAPTGDGVVLNSRAAEAIHASIGDEVTVWIELPSAIPRDTLMGKKDNDSQEITLIVRGIAPETNGLARLGLQPTQSIPQNLFIDLHELQKRLGLEFVKPSPRDPVGQSARVNALLYHDALGDPSSPIATANSLRGSIRNTLTLSDLNLRLVNGKSFAGIVLESEQMIVEDKLVEAAKRAAAELNLATSPAMVYLANKLWNPKVYQPGKSSGYSMYSTVAGLDLLDLTGSPFNAFEFLGDKPTTWGEDDVILNEFLAEDLQVKVGDIIKFAYHVIGSRGELPELERSATIRGIVKMTGAAVDRTLTPEVKGITDVDSLAEWDQPFPMELGAVTPRDDEYWNSYRAIPKMFLPLKTAQQLWPSRYGSLTSLRIAPKGVHDKPMNDVQAKELSDKFKTAMMKHVAPAEIGLEFLPVKAIGLVAAGGSNDFSGLFIGFSLFLIIAAMILIGLLFRLGIEQRIRSLGLLGAVGFTARQVGRQMLTEGILIAVIGGLIGTAAAIIYARIMIHGLTHWWVGAIGTKNLILEVTPVSLVGGFLIAVVAALCSIAWALRQLKQVSFREQLAGITEKETSSSNQEILARKGYRRASVASLIALVLIVTVVIGLIPATGAFFGVGILLLFASLTYLSANLRGEVGIAVRGKGFAGQGRLGIRNASRNRQRTVMTAAMIATAAFLIVTVAAMRRDPTSELPIKSSGNGGFTLVAESSSPILYDINTTEGRKKLQLDPPADSPVAKALAAMKVVPFRVKPGEEASCLNLYQTKVPTILGVPQSLIDEGRFAFVSGSWRDLVVEPKPIEIRSVPATVGKTSSGIVEIRKEIHTEVPIPVLGDMNTLMFSLHKGPGTTIAVPNDEAPQHQLLVKGMFQDSIFQGVLVMSEDNLLKLYPEQKGFRYFLIEVPPEQAETAASYLETELAEYGFDVERVSDRLARFLSVQNTYLSTFQTLGGLGLLLGTFGLATVMLRNVLERQAEFALLRAVGFRERDVASLVLWENAVILLWGLIAGGGSALLATSPNLFSRGAEIPIGSLAALLLLVFFTGMLASAFAIRASIRQPIVSTLRGE